MALVGCASTAPPPPPAAAGPGTTPPTPSATGAPVTADQLADWARHADAVCTDVVAQLHTQTASLRDTASRVMVTAQLYAGSYEAVSRLPRPTHEVGGDLISQLGALSTAWGTLARIVRKPAGADQDRARQAITAAQSRAAEAATRAGAPHCADLAHG